MTLHESVESTAQEELNLVDQIRRCAEPFDLADPDLDAVVERIGESRLVLLGEATHGTDEFYRMRAQLSLRLIEEMDFNIIALEADWPDVEGVNAFIHGRADSWDGFHRFPEWMWRNTAFTDFADSLRDWNASERNRKVSIYGLDLYSMHASLDAVMNYLKRRDPEKWREALATEDCLSPWNDDPTSYGLAVWNEQIKTCEAEVYALLNNLHADIDKRSFADKTLVSAMQNARVVKNAENYYRKMFEGNVASWNLRDSHMFETIQFLFKQGGPDAKIIVWEHNSHIGNALATQMSALGEHNVGQLCRQQFNQDAYLLGFMTDTGSVAAANEWGGPMETMQLNPTRKDSYESLMHRTKVDKFFLPIRQQHAAVQVGLARPRLERAVGVIYQPHTERYSHYFKANLSEQFDEVCWIDQTHAVQPTHFVPETEEPDTYPFGI